MPQMLRAERIELRPVERTDLPTFTEWFGQYELMRVLNPGAIRLVNTDAETDWYESMRKDPHQFLFAIKVIDGARTIGTCSLMGVDGKNRRATLGLSIADPAAQGQGYGFEAMTLLLEFGFLELNLNRIQLLVMQYNERAIRLYERLGFQREAVLRQAFYREGRYWDEYIMSLLRCEYQPRDGWNLEQGVTP